MSIQSAMRPRPCLYFDGVDDVVEVPHKEHLNTASEFSIFVWAKFIDSPSDRAGLVAKDNSWNIYEDKTRRITAFYYVGPLSADYVGIEYIPDISDLKAWHHVGMTFSLTEGLARLWFNGESKAQNAITVPTNINMDPLLIGVRGGSYTYRKYKGNVSEVIYYNRRLTDNEILQHMRYGAVSHNGLIGYWPLLESVGDTVYDKSMYANHGAILGAQWAHKSQAKGLEVM